MKKWTNTVSLRIAVIAITLFMFKITLPKLGKESEAPDAQSHNIQANRRFTTSTRRKWTKFWVLCFVHSDSNILLTRDIATITNRHALDTTNAATNEPLRNLAKRVTDSVFKEFFVNTDATLIQCQILWSFQIPMSWWFGLQLIIISSKHIGLLLIISGGSCCQYHREILF